MVIKKRIRGISIKGSDKLDSNAYDRKGYRYYSTDELSKIYEIEIGKDKEVRISDGDEILGKIDRMVRMQRNERELKYEIPREVVDKDELIKRYESAAYWNNYNIIKNFKPKTVVRKKNKLDNSNNKCNNNN